MVGHWFSAGRKVHFSFWRPHPWARPQINGIHSYRNPVEFWSGHVGDARIQMVVGLGVTKRPVLLPLVAQSQVKVDRKSTRLNSSHVRISYAVFCLKKKKKKK